MIALLLTCRLQDPPSPSQQPSPQIHIIREKAEHDWIPIVVSIVSSAIALGSLVLAFVSVVRSGRAQTKADSARKRLEELEGPNLEIADPHLEHNRGQELFIVLVAINRSALPDAILGVRLEYEYEGAKVLKEWEVLVQHENQQIAPEFNTRWPSAFPINVPPRTALPIRAKAIWQPPDVIREHQIPQQVRELTHTLVVRTLHRADDFRFPLRLEPRSD
jgi:hypothetical protein